MPDPTKRRTVQDLASEATVRGSYLVHVHQWTRWQGETDLQRVLGPVEEPEELLALLVDDAGGELGRASKEAWDMACEAWPPLGEHEFERIG